MGGGNYQQYYQKYMGGSGQSSGSTTELLETSGSSTGTNTGGFDYQQYMKKYAGVSQGGSSQGGSQSGDYQQYMKKYAGQYAGGSQGGSQGGSYKQYYQKYMKEYAGHHSQQNQSSSIELSESQAENYVKEYVPKKYQRKAIDSIENRTTHHAKSSLEDGSKATSADSHQDVKDQEKKMSELMMRGRFLRGTENGASEFNLIESAEPMLSSTASMRLLRQHSTATLLASLCGVALACFVFFAR